MSDSYRVPAESHEELLAERRARIALLNESSEEQTIPESTQSTILKRRLSYNQKAAIFSVGITLALAGTGYLVEHFYHTLLRLSKWRQEVFEERFNAKAREDAYKIAASWEEQGRFR